MNKVPMTAEGAEKLKEELDNLKHNERPKIAQAIKEAREKGDLKEMPNITLQESSRVSLRVELRILKLSYLMPKLLI